MAGGPSGYTPVITFPNGETQGYVIENGIPIFGGTKPNNPDSFVPGDKALDPATRAQIRQQTANQNAGGIAGPEAFEASLGPFNDASANALKVQEQFLALMKDLIGEGKPFRTELFGRATGALEHGGAAAPTDVVRASVEASRHALSKTLTDTSDTLSTVNLRGTPYGERIIADTNREGRFNISQIEPTLDFDLGKFLISTAAGVPTSSTISGGVGLGGAAAGVAGSNLAAGADVSRSMLTSLTALGAAQIGASAGIEQAIIASEAQRSAAGSSAKGETSSGLGAGGGALLAAIIAALA